MIFRSVLNKLGIKSLYYMAPLDNIPSILGKGISSYNEAQQVCHTSFASEPVQERREEVLPLTGWPLHDYVPLYFVTHTPMQYVITHASSGRQRTVRQEDLIFIELVASMVFELPGVLFTDGNAASSRTKFYAFRSNPSDLDKLDWHSIRQPNDYSVIGNLMYDKEWQRIKQSEVLVPKVVPTRTFRRVVVYCQETGDELRKRFPADNSPGNTGRSVYRVDVDESLYFNG